MPLYLKKRTLILIFAIFIFALLCTAGPLHAEEVAARSSEVPAGVADVQATSPVQDSRMAGGDSGNSLSSPGFSAGGSQFTGSATATIPIIIPPGRSAATTPQLVLTYSSSRGNGFAGMGWDLNLGAIERKVKQGFFDSENKTDRILLVTQSGSQELNPVFSGVRSYYEGEWRFKTRDGVSPKIFSAEGYVGAIYPTQVSWLVAAPDGTKHFYGTTERSRVKTHIGGAARDYVRYCLDRWRIPLVITARRWETSVTTLRFPAFPGGRSP